MDRHKFSFLILESTGEIDRQDREYEIDQGLTHAGRFLNLFRNDPYSRVARVLVDGRVLATFDSVTNELRAGR